MNIIHLNRSYLILWLLIFLANATFAQDSLKKDRGYALSASIQGGATANIDQHNELFENVFFSPGLRLLWKPNHRLTIGLESAYLTISKLDSTFQSTPYGTTFMKARLNAVPLLLVVNMKISKIDLYYGIGLSYVTSRLEAFDQKVVVSNWYYCYDLAFAYHFPLTKNMEFGVESKTYFFPKLLKISSGLFVNVSYRFLRW